MIPLSTTTVTVEEMTEAEPGEGRTASTIAIGIRAVIGSPTGAEAYLPGGGTSQVTDILNCDPVAVTHTCRVTDETTGAVYEVEWIRQRIGLGLDHTKCGLVQFTGAG